MRECKDLAEADENDKKVPLAKRVAALLVIQGLEEKRLGWVRELLDRAHGRAGVKIELTGQIDHTKRVTLELSDEADREAMRALVRSTQAHQRSLALPPADSNGS